MYLSWAGMTLRTHSAKLSVLFGSLLLSACISQGPSLDYSNQQQPVPLASISQTDLPAGEPQLETADASSQILTAVVNEEGSTEQDNGAPNSNGQHLEVASASTTPADQTTAASNSGVLLANGEAQSAGLAGDVTNQNDTTLVSALTADTAIPIARPRPEAAAAIAQIETQPVEQAALTPQNPAPQVKKKPKKSGFSSFFSSVRKKFRRPRSDVKTASVKKRNRSGSRSALPGVRSNSKLFGIDEDDDTQSRTTQVAALGGFARVSPNGLRIQHDKVQVSCLKPEVIRLLKTVERRYRKKPIITSGYRSPKRNRRAGGARNSQHIFCKAVDIQVEGVSKWDLAKYLRTLPGRGGVGTYCRTKSVHIDIGSKRDWHHPCRRSTVRKRKKRA